MDFTCEFKFSFKTYIAQKKILDLDCCTIWFKFGFDFGIKDRCTL